MMQRWADYGLCSRNALDRQRTGGNDEERVDETPSLNQSLTDELPVS